MSASTPKARIQKGKNLENYLCEQLAQKGIDSRARRSYGSGNSDGIKADIDTSATILGIAAGFECKHVDRIKLNEQWKQTCKLIDKGYEPVLVIKQTADDYGDSKAVIYLDTLLEMMKRLQDLGVIHR